MIKQVLPPDIEAGFNEVARTLTTAGRIRALAQLRARAEVQIGRARQRGDAEAAAAEIAACRQFQRTSGEAML